MAQTESVKPLCYVSTSDVGCVRKLNEDCVYCSDTLWLIADGMGGHACGDVASLLAAETIAQAHKRGDSLSLAIELAHEKVLAQGQGTDEQKGMGTTVVALAGDINEYQVAWVGDSRAYLWRHQTQQFVALTKDHSLVSELVKQGLLTQEQASLHPKRHVITRCLGSRSNRAFKVDLCQGQWHPKDIILLCSDGLSDELSDTLIAQTIAQSRDCAEILQGLVAQAKDKGGRDNISIVLVQNTSS